MNCEVDNTKYAKVMIIETNDRRKDTQKELAEYIFGLFDKGWKTLESMSMTPTGNRTVLYWPEYHISCSGKKVACGECVKFENKDWYS